MEEFEYFETMEVQGERDADMIQPPVPDGAGWALVERLVIDKMVVFRWRRARQAKAEVRRVLQ